MGILKKRILTFLLLISILFYNIFFMNDSSADTNNRGVYDAGYALGGTFFSSKASCGPFATIVTTLYLMNKGQQQFRKGWAKARKKPPPSNFSMALAIGQAVVGLGLIVGPIIAASTTWQCYFSFVRDPVALNSSNEMLKRDENGNLVTTDNHWDAIKVPYSESIEVCARSPFPYISKAVVEVPGLGSAAGLIGGVDWNTASAGKEAFGCYHKNLTDEEWEETNNLFDGKGSYLCPEEWRFHNYKYDISQDNSDPDNPSFIHMAKIEDEKNIEAAPFVDMRKNSGPLMCERTSFGKKIFLFNYEYKIIKMGAKICAQIGGLGGIPSFKHLIGCHYAPPDDLRPLCSESVPIKITHPVTNEEKIMDYDNEKCFPCFINKSCYNSSAIHAKSVFPVTSLLAECLERTLHYVMFGCPSNSTQGSVAQINPSQNVGMFTIINKNIRNISYICILFAVIFLAFKILLGGHIPQVNELMSTALKIGIVLFVVHTNASSNGMMWIYDQVKNFSSGLSELMLNASSANNGICKFSKTDYTSTTVGNISSASFEFLKPFDILDCYMFFYLGGALFGYMDDDDEFRSRTFTDAIPNLLAIAFPFLLMINPVGFFMFFFIIVFTIFLLAMIVWLVSIIIFAMIFLYLLILFSPLVFPFILFKYTKSFFDNWVKEVFTYMMVPPFLYLYLSFVMIVMHKPMFGDTKFIEVPGPQLGFTSSKFFVYEKLNCKNAINSNNTICKNCEEYRVPESLCDGCDLKGLACRFRPLGVAKTGIHHVSNSGDLGNAITMVSHSYLSGGVGVGWNELWNSYLLDMVNAIGYIIVMLAIFLTLNKVMLAIIIKAFGNSRTLMDVARLGYDPMKTMGVFFGYVKKPFGILVNSSKNNKKSKKNNSKGKDNKKQGNVKGTFE